MNVPTLHLRNVPAHVYDELRKRAKRHGRSMNAEAVALLEGAVERDRRSAEITERLRRHALAIDLPPDAPKPEEIIRHDRDTR